MSLFLRCVVVQVESPDTYCSKSHMTQQIIYDTVPLAGATKSDQKNDTSLGHFWKQTCDTIPVGRHGLRHTSCGHNSKWAFFWVVTLLLGVRFGSFEKGFPPPQREAACTVTKVRPNWLVRLGGTTPSRHTGCTVVGLYYSSALKNTSLGCSPSFLKYCSPLPRRFSVIWRVSCSGIAAISSVYSAL
jgi:hypothetical protein